MFALSALAFHAWRAAEDWRRAVHCWRLKCDVLRSRDAPLEHSGAPSGPSLNNIGKPWADISSVRSHKIFFERSRITF